MPGDYDSLFAAAAADLDPQLASLVQRATPQEREALLRALRDAYTAGQQEADQRTGSFVARVLAPLMGLPSVPAGEAVPASPRRRLSAAARHVAGLLVG